MLALASEQIIDGDALRDGARIQGTQTICYFKTGLPGVMRANPRITL